MSRDDEAELYHCRARCLRETDRALLIELQPTDDELDRVERWIPKSLVHDDSEVFDAGEHAEGTLVVEGWWAAEKGLP